MVFNDTTNKNGIVQLVERLCKLGDGGITNDTTLFKQITGDINQAYKKVAMAMLQVDKNWKFDDSNYTDFPIATINLVDQQRDYTLPASTTGGNASTLWRVNRVRVKDSAGEYYDLSLLDPQADETRTATAYTGTPTHYRMIGNSIRLSPIPNTNNVTLTAGLEITFQRSGTEFTTASTTAQPGGIFDTYHDLLAYDASATYLMPFNTQLAINYMQIFNNRLEMLKDDYKHKNTDIRDTIRPKYRNPA